MRRQNQSITNRHIIRLITAIALVFAMQAQTDDSFYAGKVVTIIVGSTAGGGLDAYARVIARHIGRHIPGTPEVRVQNMPGAGTLVAAHYFFYKVPADGLTIGSWSGFYTIKWRVEDKPDGIKPAKFGWIGAPVSPNTVCALMARTGIDSIDAWRASSRPLKFGSSSRTNMTHILMRFMGNATSLPIQLITGYKGTSNIRLALQTGEIDGACFSWPSMRSTARAMLDAEGDDKLIPLIRVGDPGDPEVADLVEVHDLIDDPSDIATLDSMSAGFELHRSYTTPPGTPKDRLEILRRAFDATMSDEAFLADIERAGLVVNPIRGHRLEEYVNLIVSMPAAQLEALRPLVDP
ncbi:MAG: hypothetical protein DHS20C01_10990 [marine bacterium B5-7]|nr:MAG: hypothetical protein DHS20C01_10990 [marine bacterium B5-7]